MSATRISAEMEAVREAAAKEAEDHELRLEGVRIEFDAALDEAQVGHQRAEGALEQLRVELVTADERHQAQLTTLRSDAVDAVVASRAKGEDRLRVALEDQAAHLAELHRGELATLLAEARATAAETEPCHRGELAEARLAEIGRLVTQLPAAGGSPRGD
ncbi:MAG: hypothetical protein ACYCV7_15505 [Acidimicrobiales bacterium]